VALNYEQRIAVLSFLMLCYFISRDTSLANKLQDLDISQGSVLYDIDEATVRSLNGCRVADQILRLVPNIQVD
jgi:poly(A) polymerase Pap1